MRMIKLSSNFSELDKSYGPTRIASKPLTLKISSKFLIPSVLSIIAIKIGLILFLITLLKFFPKIFTLENPTLFFLWWIIYTVSDFK